MHITVFIFTYITKRDMYIMVLLEEIEYVNVVP